MPAELESTRKGLGEAGFVPVSFEQERDRTLDQQAALDNRVEDENRYSSNAHIGRNTGMTPCQLVRRGGTGS